MSIVRQARTAVVSGASDNLCERCSRYPAVAFTDEKLLCGGCILDSRAPTRTMPSFPGVYYLGKDALYYFNGSEMNRLGEAG